jgi:hypothetical protein
VSIPAIRIGVAMSDVSRFVAIDAAYGIGDQRTQVEAVIDRWRREGDLPCAGRDIDLSFHTFDATDTDGKRAVADRLAAEGVLAVIGARDFTYGAVRLAERHHTPVLDVNAVPRALLARAAPWLFTLRTAQDLIYTTFVRWAHDNGLLDGRRIGVFSDRFTAASADVALAELDALGHRVTTHVRSEGAGVGSDRDEEAARLFGADRIDTIFPFVSGSSLVRMLTFASELGYRPQVLDVETGEHATDVTASLMPPGMYDGTLALVMNRIGEIPAGRRLDPLAERAIADVERFTGRRLARTGRDTSGEVSNILIVHDLAEVLMAGLRNAGPDVTRESLVAGLERIDAMPSASGGGITFRAGEHWGFREMRSVQWSAASGTWAVRTEYEPVMAGDATATEVPAR